MSRKVGQKLACDECTACCTALGISELKKPANQPCPELLQLNLRRTPGPGERTTGCSIYGRRPRSCREFECLWLMGYFGGDPLDRPDRCGLVFSVMRNTKFGEAVLSAHEAWPGASKQGRGKEIMDALKNRVLIMVISRDLREFIGPPEELQRVAGIMRAVTEERARKELGVQEGVTG